VERAIEPPIVVAEGNDVSVYRSLADVSRSLEAVDVDDGVYEAWDAPGHRLLLSTDPPFGRATMRSVHVSLAVDAPDSSSGLPPLLVALLRSAGIPADAKEDVAALVDRVVIWQGYR
jgi:hypothetical protein